MKAVVYTSYGSPDGLRLREIEKPTPKDEEVLIRVYAAAANPLDWHKLRASPFFVRFSEGFLKPKHPVLGADVAGRVELDAVGNLSAAGYRRILTSEGRAVVAGFTTLSRMLFQVALLGSITSKTSKRTITPMLAAVKQEDLTTLATLLEQGKVESVIDRRYPLADTPKALAYLETGRARGKVVISVQPTQYL